MNNLTKQTVYLPVKEETEYTTPSWSGPLEQNEGYFLTPEQLNEYTANVIKQALETAAKKAQLSFIPLDELLENVKLGSSVLIKVIK